MIRSVLAACLVVSIALPALSETCDTLAQSQEKARHMAESRHYELAFLDGPRARTFLDVLASENPGAATALHADHLALFRKPDSSNVSAILADGPCGGFRTLVIIDSFQTAP